ncbi:MAG: helix-turn-helix transcriptional regulator [Burkholderiales bacterium]|nr:helix-turn-helix transcriptional regulator [Burkholderiales bacterium]
MATLSPRACTSLERAAEVFSLLSTVPRLRIVKALCGRELCVGELATAIGMPPSGLSHQLNLLYRSGLLARRRQGAQVYYRTSEETGRFLCSAVGSFLPPTEKENS